MEGSYFSAGNERDTSLDVLSFLDTLGPDNGTVERCYSTRSHSTVLQGLPFGGVPTVLAINFILWLVLLLVFSCLRKAAWDYGRLALVMDNDRAGGHMEGSYFSAGNERDTSLDVLSFLDTLGPDNGTVERCYSTRSHSTVLQGLPFGGVPTVLAINFILWLVLLLVFSCLRKAAWDYGRLALVMDNDRSLKRGLLYMILKHLVDRYNIYYAYVPTKLNQRIHSAAISQVIIAPILCMFWLLFFSVLRLGPVRPITLFTFVALLFCILFSLFGFCLKRLQPKKPTSYQMSDQHTEGVFNDNERSSVSSTPNSNIFVASVLQEPELGLTPMPSPAHQSYGTMENRMETPRTEEETHPEAFESDLENRQYFSSGPLVDSDIGYH
ncbi:UNVERIFIED_CONTAM: hypothetical protein FKN15_070240 [Acipenser sinensis]